MNPRRKKLLKLSKKKLFSSLSSCIVSCYVDISVVFIGIQVPPWRSKFTGLKFSSVATMHFPLNIVTTQTILRISLIVHPLLEVRSIVLRQSKTVALLSFYFLALKHLM